jgi:hypothetical protein
MAYASTARYNSVNSNEPMKMESINEMLHELKKVSEKIGLTPEIQDIIDSVETSHISLRKKINELKFLQAIAMESMDDNIVVLRTQLFATVKLIHNDLLQELMGKQEIAIEVEVDFGIGSNNKEDHFDEKKNISKNSVWNNIRNYVKIRKEYKKFYEKHH